MNGSSYSKTGALKKTICALSAALAVSVLAASAPGVIAADASDAVTAVSVSRYFLALADDRCHALQPDAAAALKAGYVQARNAALRAGHSMDDLGPWLQRARAAAAAVPCGDAKLTKDFADAGAAYRRFIVQTRLDLPGVRAGWTADRAYGDDARWRLVQYQNLPDADVALGLYGPLDAPRFTVMADFHGGEKPYAARLLTRDPDRLGSGLIDAGAFALTPAAPAGFGSDSLSFMARDSAEVRVALRPEIKTNLAGFTLTGQHVAETAGDAVRFDFPSRAWPAIARLDPREDMVVEFDFDDGPRYARFEVGDFVTGLTYVTLPQPYTHNRRDTAN